MNVHIWRRLEAVFGATTQPAMSFVLDHDPVCVACTKIPVGFFGHARLTKAWANPDGVAGWVVASKAASKLQQKYPPPSLTQPKGGVRCMCL